MGQKPYFRDVWVLGQCDNGYPGAFPRGLVAMVQKRWWGQKRLWMFSGSYQDPSGTTVDINPKVKPSVIADCQQLPFEDESFDFVFADPPYSEEEAHRLYNLEYPSITKVINEGARVTKPGGYFIFLHRLVPFCHPTFNIHFKRLKIEGVVGIAIMSGLCNIRSMTVFRKMENLSQYGTENTTEKKVVK